MEFHFLCYVVANECEPHVLEIFSYLKMCGGFDGRLFWSAVDISCKSDV
jgi:hypothetical protein